MPLPSVDDIKALKAEVMICVTQKVNLELCDSNEDKNIPVFIFLLSLYNLRTHFIQIIRPAHSFFPPRFLE